jgi:hypothetical protein
MTMTAALVATVNNTKMLAGVSAAAFSNYYDRVAL